MKIARPALVLASLFGCAAAYVGCYADLDWGSNVVGTSSTSASSSASSGSGMPGCDPGASESCYSGPAGTAGIGLCKAGSRTCQADRTWGPCVGEVLPQPEDCATPEDEDCDGTTPACECALLWAKRFGDASDQAAQGIVADADGNVLVTGYFVGSIDFGDPDGPLVSAGGRDVFVAKLGPGGEPRWSKRFGDATDQVGMAIAVDATGNVLVTGHFAGTVDFGGGGLASAGSDDVFVMKLDPDGHHVWSRRFGDSAGQYGASIAVDGAGYVLAAGYFVGAIDLGAGPVPSAGNTDAFVVKLDPADGNPLWGVAFGGAGADASLGVAADGTGDVLLTGYFSDSVSFGGDTWTSAGATDIFVVKLQAATGQPLWSRGFGDAHDQEATSIATDSAGHAVVTGNFFGSLALGGGPLVSLGQDDIFSLRLDPGGAHEWSYRFGGTSYDDGLAVAVDPTGNVLLTGYFFGDGDFGGGTLTSSGMDDVFLVKLKQDGSFLCGQRFGDAAKQQATGVAADALGNALLTGFFAGSVDFGGGPLVSAGGTDIFVAKFTP